MKSIHTNFVAAIQRVCKYFGYALLALLLLSGCQKKSVCNELSLKKNKNVLMKISDYLLYPEDSNIIKSWDSQSLKFVIYNDSTECSLCKIKELEEWNEIAERYNKYSELGFYMLFSASGRSKTMLMSSIKCQDIHIPILIDTIGDFSKKNEHIEKCRMAHCFLIDKQNCIVLLGNPLKNKKVESMLDKILIERLGTETSQNANPTPKDRVS